MRSPAIPPHRQLLSFFRDHRARPEAPVVEKDKRIVQRLSSIIEDGVHSRPPPYTYTDLLNLRDVVHNRDLLVENAANVHQKLLRMTAGRLIAHASLPYLPAINPSLRNVFHLYSVSFASLANRDIPRTHQDNDAFCEMLQSIVHSHANTVPQLAQGFQQARKYLSDAAISSFLDDAIHARVSMRLMAHHHLALNQQAKDNTLTLASGPESAKFGLLDVNLDITQLVSSCAEYVQQLCDLTYGIAPNFIVSQSSDTPLRISVVGSHVQYGITEVLKNAFRATTERYLGQADDGDALPPVEIAVGSTPGVLGFRVRDHGGGIPAEDLDNVFSYAFTTVPRDEDGAADVSGIGSTTLGTLAGLGYGAPMSQIFANYFGGSMTLSSLHDWGTDAYYVIKAADPLL